MRELKIVSFDITSLLTCRNIAGAAAFGLMIFAAKRFYDQQNAPKKEQENVTNTPPSPTQTQQVNSPKTTPQFTNQMSSVSNPTATPTTEKQTGSLEGFDRIDSHNNLTETYVEGSTVCFHKM